MSSASASRTARRRPHPVIPEMDRVVRQPGYRRRFDYIFVGSSHAHPHASCRIDSAELAFTEPVDGLWLSDHFGVIADLEIGRDD